MSERNGPLRGLRLMSVAIALLLWVFVSVEHRGERPAEKVVEAAVTYNPPPGMIILNPVERVRVRLRGSERLIRQVNPYLVDVQVELPREARGRVERQIGPDNVLAPEGLEVISVEPRLVQLQLDQEVKRLVPVRVRFTGEPAAGAVVAGPARVRPEQVLVTGPSTLVSAIDNVETTPINLDGHALDYEETALLSSPDSLVKLQTQVVSVTIPMRQTGPGAEGSR